MITSRLSTGDTSSSATTTAARRTTSTPAPAAASMTTSRTPASSVADDKSRGAQLYQQICAACHMPDGNGVSSMQPALVGSAVVSGDPATLIRVVLNGPAQVLPASRPKYANQMPPFDATMNDADVAEVLSFTRRAFGKGASPITASQVAAQRGAPASKSMP